MVNTASIIYTPVPRPESGGNVFCPVIINSKNNNTLNDSYDCIIRSLSGFYFRKHNMTPGNITLTTDYYVFYRIFNTTDPNMFNKNINFTYAPNNNDLNIVLSSETSVELMIAFRTVNYVVLSAEEFIDNTPLKTDHINILQLVSSRNGLWCGDYGLPELVLDTSNPYSYRPLDTYNNHLATNSYGVPTPQLLFTTNFEWVNLTNNSFVPPTPPVIPPFYIEEVQPVSFSKSEPVIKSFSIPSIVFGSDSFKITPPKSENNTKFTYKSSDPSIAIVVGDNIEIIRPGKVEIIATQESSPYFSGASIKTTLEITAPSEKNPVSINNGDQLLNFIKKGAYFGKLNGEIMIDEQLSPSFNVKLSGPGSIVKSKD